MALEILPPSLISDLTQTEPIAPRRYDRRDASTDANGVSDVYAHALLGLPVAAHVRQPRAFTADSPSKASGSGRHAVTRSRRHYSTESEG